MLARTRRSSSGTRAAWTWSSEPQASAAAPLLGGCHNGRITGICVHAHTCSSVRTHIYTINQGDTMTTLITRDDLKAAIEAR